MYRRRRSKAERERRAGNEAAALAYRSRILADPHDRDAWVGFGLATGAPALLARPETVQALYLRLLTRTTPDPTDLAAWLAPA